MNDSFSLKQPLPEGWKQSMTNCFSYAELKAIPIKENNEPLVDLTAIESSGLGIGPTPEKLKSYVPYGMWVRQSVAERLQLAQQLLEAQQPSYQIFVRYGYRHPEVQKKYFDDFYKKSKEQFSQFGDDELLEYVHHYMAIPEVGGHPAGAALDVLLIDKAKGEDVDMGSRIADFTDMSKVLALSTSITEQQLRSRLLLRQVMMEAGFAPYDFEWWHFSFGDREWACYYKKEYAVYGEIDFRLP